MLAGVGLSSSLLAGVGLSSCWLAGVGLSSSLLAGVCILLSSESKLMAFLKTLLLDGRIG